MKFDLSNPMIKYGCLLLVCAFIFAGVLYFMKNRNNKSSTNVNTTVESFEQKEHMTGDNSENNDDEDDDEEDDDGDDEDDD